MITLKNIYKLHGLKSFNPVTNPYNKNNEKKVTSTFMLNENITFASVEADRSEYVLDNLNTSYETSFKDDIYFSSKIEGIELNVSESSSDDSNKDFKSLVDLYNVVLSEDYIDHEVMLEISNIYNDLILQKENKIKRDDDLYRNNRVGIYKEGKNGVEELVHEGVNHNLIIESMENIFDLMNLEVNEDDLDKIIEIASDSHVLFEYVHPYFDANGRIGRLLMFWVLNKYIDKNISVNVSRIIYANRGKYYQSLLDSQKSKKFNYFRAFLKEVIKESVNIEKKVSEIYEAYNDLKQKEISFIKELLIVGLFDGEVSYSMYKREYGINYAKTTFFRTADKLQSKGVLESEVRNNKKFYRLSENIR